MEGLYTAGMWVARGLSRFAGGGEGKLARGIRGRRGTVERIEAWAARERRPDSPLLWFHAPSVGEGLQARAVIEEIRERRPDAQLAYTFFSPSAEPFAARLPVDVADYLPLDVPGDVSRVFDALKPNVVAFTKTEIWPNVTREAARRSIPVVLLSATLPESSSRLGPLSRRLLSASHARLAKVAAISQADADRYAALGVPEERRTVMGDARFDQVWRRAGSARDSALVQALAAPDIVTLVAGSTWPPDEERLVPAYARVAVPRAKYRLIIAPHEPIERHLADLERRLEANELRWSRLSRDEKMPDERFDVLVVDRVGVLGDLYALADVAYVGGGFGNAGLHSVLEPAAFGVPILFGPNHSNAREASSLIGRAAAISALDGDALASALDAWFRDPTLRHAAGSAARALVAEGIGAAAAGAAIVLDLLEGGSGGPEQDRAQRT